MRTAILTSGVLAAVLLVGACFDPTRPCSTDADCVNGSCDPGTKTCVSGGNPNDKTPPVFSIVVAPPPARQATANLTVYDPGSPDGGVDAFRRDENVSVTVSSADHDVDAGSVKLTVYGVAANSGTGLAVQLAPCPPANPSAASPFCRVATVSLGPPLPFEAFRSAVPLEVSGADLSNNLGKADAGVNVTRWKWRYSAGAPIYTTPAIADDGTIVFGTSDGGSGSLVALTPSGGDKWNAVQLGQTKASPVIGSGDSGQQVVYVGTASGTSGNLYAINLRDGTIVARCPSSGGSYAAPFVGTPSVVTSGSASFEGALGVANGLKLVNIRSGPTLPDDRCVAVDTVATQGYPANLVASGTESFAAGGDGNVFAFTRQSGIWLDNTFWGGGSGSASVSNRPIQSLALSSRLFGTTRLRGVFELNRGTGVLLANYPDAGLQADPGGLLLVASQLIFPDGLSTNPGLLVVADSFGQGSLQPIPEAVTGSPVMGAGSWLYSATTSGTLLARDLSEETSWSGSLGPMESFLGSPTIDCGARDAGIPVASSTGVLYLGSTSGGFFAVLVDSPGLDATAPWPKYQHDVRNTGNPTTPIQSCP